mgnify:CR=1 FL=1|tara:strand:+ start:594 stop:947 length:354 start_codon:yes stop_codon:yes gene_type:complete
MNLEGMKNDDVTYVVEDIRNMEYCFGCQTPEGKKFTGLSTHRNMPIDVRKVTMSLAVPDQDPLEKLANFCTDCIVVAQNAGVNVLDSQGRDWKPNGFILRPELVDREDSTGKKERDE